LTTGPARLSLTVITGVLRGQLGFNGLVITDSLSATAIQAAGYGIPAATVQALRAGADLVLYNATPISVAALTQQVVASIVSAVSVGSLSRSRLENAVAHILSAKHTNLCRP
jgi:beta-N-acetylhexosaminidase